MTTQPLLQPLLKHLHSSARLRVWSIVITIFGDAVQVRGGRVAMAELQAIVDALGIEGGALRTAMSRLAKEGWVERDREGRNSYYRLAPSRQDEVASASDRIYAASFTDGRSGWLLAIAPPDTADPGLPGLPLDRATRLIAAEDAERARQQDCLLIAGTPDHVPPWAADAVFDPALTRDYAIFSDLVDALAGPSAALTGFQPLEAMVARTLLIHHWRRLVLRHAPPPDTLLPPDWPGLRAHRALGAIYPALVTASEPWWSTPTPAPGLAALRARFR